MTIRTNHLAPLAQMQSRMKFMTHRSRLKFASLMFAVLWTSWMIWCLWPMRPAEIGMLSVSGALAGCVWYWLYGSWYRWYFASRLFPRRHMN